MKTTEKIALGVSLASSFLFAAWLLTGERKVKTKDFVSKRAENLKSALRSDRTYLPEVDSYYI